MNNEDLYRQMQDEEDEFIHRTARQLKANIETTAAKQRPVNESAARERYRREIAPVLEANRRAAAGLPITNNPIKNAWLKITGQDKPKPVEIVDPVFGLAIQTGKTVEEVRQEMIEHPELYPDLAKKPEEVRPVSVQRKSPSDFATQ